MWEEHPDPVSALSDAMEVLQMHLTRINPNLEGLDFDLAAVKPKGKPPGTKRHLSHDEAGSSLKTLKK